MVALVDSLIYGFAFFFFEPDTNHSIFGFYFHFTPFMQRLMDVALGALSAQILRTLRFMTFPVYERICLMYVPINVHVAMH